MSLSPFVLLNQAVLSAGISVKALPDWPEAVLLAGAGGTLGIYEIVQVDPLFKLSGTLHQKAIWEGVTFDLSLGVTWTKFRSISPAYWGIPLGVGFYW